MSYYIMFNNINTLKDDRIIQDFAWWKEVVEKLFLMGEFFEIRCWPSEQEGLDSARRFGHQIENHETKEIVFDGMITRKMVEEIQTNYLSKNGLLKWFSLFIKYRNGDQFSCEHNGAEMYYFDTTQERAEEIRSWAIKYKCFKQMYVGNTKEDASNYEDPDYEDGENTNEE